MLNDKSPGLNECPTHPNLIKEIGVIKDIQVKTLAKAEEIFNALNGSLQKRGLLARMEYSERSMAILTRVVIVLCGIIGIESFFFIMKFL
jgi:hypothetical protein